MTQRFRRIAVSQALLAIWTFGICGCGGGAKSDVPVLNPVEGSVLFNGQPAEGAVVEFHAAAGGSDATKIRGQVDDNGNFITISTRAEGIAAGAEPGEYKVSVTYDPTKNPEYSGPGFPDRYKDPATSGLTATVIAQKEANKLPKWELTP